MRTRDFDPGTIPPEYPLVNLPIDAVARKGAWKLSSKGVGDQERFFIEPSAKKSEYRSRFATYRSYPVVAVREVCNEFLSIDNGEDAVKFFEQFGPVHLETSSSGRNVWLDRSKMILTEIQAPHPLLGRSTKQQTALTRATSITWEELQFIKLGFEAEIMGEPSPPRISEFVWNQTLDFRMQVPLWWSGQISKGIRPERRLWRLERLQDEAQDEGQRFQPKSTVPTLPAPTVAGMCEPIPDKDGRLQGKDDGAGGIGRYPRALVLCTDVAQAIRANIILSRIATSKWSRCQECLKVFQQDKQYDSRFCSAVHQINWKKREYVRRRRERNLESSKSKGKRK